VLTSGLTFLTVLSLYIFGGQVLNGFSFALVIGILIGTYSSIAVAAPMLVAWQDGGPARGKRRFCCGKARAELGAFFPGCTVFWCRLGIDATLLIQGEHTSVVPF